MSDAGTDGNPRAPALGGLWEARRSPQPKSASLPRHIGSHSLRLGSVIPRRHTPLSAAERGGRCACGQPAKMLPPRGGCWASFCREGHPDAGCVEDSAPVTQQQRRPGQVDESLLWPLGLPVGQTDLGSGRGGFIFQHSPRASISSQEKWG